MTTDHAAQSDARTGAQRLPLAKLKAWEQLQYGMFIHFGMSTYDGNELSLGDRPASHYAPDALDVDQWVRVAAESGMRYAVLTAKHVSGFCLWPTDHTDYHVGHSSNPTDVVERFFKACERYDVKPGLYYCSWDNHHRMGSDTPTFATWERSFTTQAYRDFQLAQIEELLTRYGRVVEVWIDIPQVLGADGRRRQYAQIASLQPDALIMMNNGFGDGSKLNYANAWPTDLMAIERWLPASNRGYNPWHALGPRDTQTQDYYISGEVCDPIGYQWFFVDGDHARSDAELLGMRLISRERRTNLLLNVPPDRHGVLPADHVAALMRLAKSMRQFGR